MKYGNARQSLPAYGLMLLFLAGASASGETVSQANLPAAVLATGQQCLPAPETCTATWIDSRDQLDRFTSRCRAHRLGADSAMLPDIDFKRFCVLALEMGQQLSAGYGYDTEKVAAFVQGHSAIVSVTDYQPAPGSITAQMVTNPWILIRLPIGLFDSIQVVDHHFRLLTRTTTNAH